MSVRYTFLLWFSFCDKDKHSECIPPGLNNENSYVENAKEQSAVERQKSEFTQRIILETSMIVSRK